MHYFLQTLIFQLLFLIIYDLFLKKETFFITNRWYLILAPFLGLVAPFIAFPSMEQELTVSELPVMTTISTIKKTLNSSDIAMDSEALIFQWEWILWIGNVVFFILFLGKLLSIKHFISIGKKTSFEKFKIIELPNSTTAFSFFKYVFLGQQLVAAKKKTILAHELVHIRHHHSYDLMFFELLRIAMWYNPLLYIFHKRITELHEFTVDAEIAKKEGKQSYYQQLLAEVFDVTELSFVNQFYHQSLIKKRISMLTQKKSKRIQQLKYLSVLPVLLGIVFYTSCTEDRFTNEVTEIDSNASSTKSDSNVFKSWPKTSYLSGDIPKAFDNIDQQFDKAIDNYLKINTTPKTEAVVKLVRTTDSTCIRVVYLREESEVFMKNIPEGKYFLKIAYGNDWREKEVDGKLKGCFNEKPIYKTGDHVLDFTLKKLSVGIDVPSYELLIDVVSDEDDIFYQKPDLTPETF